MAARYVSLSCMGKTSFLISSRLRRGAALPVEETGELEGTYSISESSFLGLINRLSYTINKKGRDEVLELLKIKAPHVGICSDRDLVPVGNGLFDYKSKKLTPFTPDKVFLRKSPVDYNPSAQNPVIHNPDDGTDWDVASWMDSLSDDPEVVELLWQVIGAVIRPEVNWGRLAMLYSEKGNNGKGTLCRLMEYLCGKENCASIKMQDFAKDFILESLIGASAIIVDENDVGAYLDKASNFKATVTGDTIQINRKYKAPVSYKFRGFMVQCINELPKTKDKSGSLYRRMLLIPFTKCFTGMERKYIKNDYLKRKEVLEYVLWRVLNMDYYELDEPAACRMLMADFREENEPVLAFWEEFRDQFVWDLLPFGFLYDLYKAWHDRFNRSGTLMGHRTFYSELRNAIADDPEWKATMPRGSAVATGTKMAKPEALILRYHLVEWADRYAVGYDTERYCTTKHLEKAYRGVYRVAPAAASTGSGD